jgi:hypothetical protein
LDSTHKEENQIIPLEQKILIQGGNQTGKTSIFMQINILKNGADNYYWKGFLSIIQGNIIKSTDTILKECLKINSNPFDDSKNVEHAKVIMNLVSQGGIYEDNFFTLKVYKMVTELWKENIMMEMLQENGHKLNIFDNFQYFLDRLEKLAPPDYVPSMEDAIHSRINTSITECVIKNENMNIFDIGSHRRLLFNELGNIINY